MAPKVDLVLDAHAEVAESPSWDAVRDTLLWVDIYKRSVHLFSPCTGLDRSINVGQPVGAVAPATTGGVILALRDRFAVLDPATGALVDIAEIAHQAPDALMNDGKCDAQGRFLAGSTTVSETQHAAALYRLEPYGAVEVLLDGVTLSNGIDWSPDGRVLYYVDSALQRIDTFRYDNGHVSRRRTFAEIPTSAGTPDGLTVDARGHVWIALWGGSALRRYSPEGVPEENIRLPVSQVTSCAFGGSDWRDLFVTTASWGMDANRLETEPHAGGIFAIRPPIGGLPTRQFRGSGT
jgi:sugar lactone lactonase YvrE